MELKSVARAEKDYIFIKAVIFGSGSDRRKISLHYSDVSCEVQNEE